MERERDLYDFSDPEDLKSHSEVAIVTVCPESKDSLR